MEIHQKILYPTEFGFSELRKNNPEKLKQWTTAIFYINTNNGYTEFEDGTRVESVANRIVNFPANLKHRGTRCTDQKIRIVINFNYFKKYDRVYVLCPFVSLSHRNLGKY